MEVKAYARHIHMSPRKVRLVAALVRGMDVDQAVTQLRFMRKDAARPVLKLILSAVANAEHNFKLPSDHLYIKTSTVDGGPVLKRWRARAFGRAAEIKKRSCHITIVLDERKVAGKPSKAVASAVVKPSAASPAKGGAASKKTAAKPAKTRKSPAAGGKA